MLTKLEINNQVKARFKKKSLGELFKRIYKHSQRDKNKTVVLSLAFVTPAEIRGLNRDFRGVDSVTDTLSFNYEIGSGPRTFCERCGVPTPIGDIIICYEQAKKQAKAKKHSIQKEIEFLFIHSLLHLLGYDHKNEVEERKMYKLQNLFFK